MDPKEKKDHDSPEPDPVEQYEWNPTTQKIYGADLESEQNSGNNDVETGEPDEDDA